MTNAQLDKNRYEIVSDYFTVYHFLDLENEMGICLSSSSVGIYHIFSRADKAEGAHLDLKFEYSVAADGFKKVVKSLPVEKIKDIFIEFKLKSYENKLIKKYSSDPINILDHENLS